ncbi:MAG: hypothetical protein M1818_001564 [Claussenomyces sp. TS43310]|nr:MAG: hypothetical protein M1818_001564 [Claussenomyces sp. TS43310]
MAEEPTLPSLPSGSTRQSISGSSQAPKRVRLHSTSPPISSDPPLFSSDDDPSAENYAGLRRHSKRKFRGPWYSQKLDESTDDQQRGKRKLQRQFDSAIWLGSDATEGEVDAEFLENSQIPITPTSSQHTMAIRPVSTPYRSSQPTTEASSPEERAKDQIDECLDMGKQDIDLSARGLTHLSNATIKPLSTFVPVHEITGEAGFQSLRPALKIFLSSNMLTRLPGEIFKVEGLRVLSLRSNQLLELPTAIGKLNRLVELNIANNLLRFLPYEIMDLLSDAGRLHSLQIHPNPFYEPDMDSLELRSLRRGRPASSSVPNNSTITWKKDFRYRSHVRFTDIDGTLLKGPVFPGDQSLFNMSGSKGYTHSSSSILAPCIISRAPADDVPEPPQGSGPNFHIPSLLELAVRAYCRSPRTAGLDQRWEWKEDAPEHLSHILRDAKALYEMEAGVRNCTICHRDFVIPRTEWIEWWQIEKVQRRRAGSTAASSRRQTENQRDQIERLVPLMRRGCSWKCVPRKGRE